jgi:hypothetical protein
MNFRIERLYDSCRDVIVLAKRLGAGTLCLANSENPSLGGVPVRPLAGEARRYTADGRTDGLLAFVLADRQDKDRIPEGQIVELRL